jgi:hypothetical protein
MKFFFLLYFDAELQHYISQLFLLEQPSQAPLLKMPSIRPCNMRTTCLFSLLYHAVEIMSYRPKRPMLREYVAVEILRAPLRYATCDEHDKELIPISHLEQSVNLARLSVDINI